MAQCCMINGLRRLKLIVTHTPRESANSLRYDTIAAISRGSRSCLCVCALKRIFRCSALSKDEFGVQLNSK